MDELLAIGEFAARSGLSAKVLRSYAAAGLLVPAAVDPWSGYRYYAPGQLPEARLIRLLRQAGIPVGEIAAFLREPRPEQLQHWERELDREAAARRRALAEARGALGTLARSPGSPAALAGSPAGQDGGMAMVTLAAGSATDRGRVRESNQDSLLVSPPLFAVADGLGGHRAGDVASQLAIETLRDRFSGPPGTEALATAVAEAGRAVWQRADSDPALEGMGTTLTAVVVLEREGQVRLAVANVGDSRAYLFQHGQLSLLTRDDTVVQALIDAGEIEPERGRTHPQRSLLTRALGMSPVVEADISVPAVTGSARLLLCSDGLTTEADDDQIAAVLAAAERPDDAATALVRLANDNGGSDNITVVVVDIAADPQAQ
ncbi:MAG: protein phosphatase 2C domain-containing protein [Actinobacteria bacterium]|nr:protein phosphatase 2C domain-containing protein [Actinomycetota bacterium]MBO0785660.1 protein phosphatase 2C domain-containing protein [Actinomycetota bacterium]